ncbi:MAG: TerB family tellurite resistance protein [Robiginitalea sp.]
MDFNETEKLGVLKAIDQVLRVDDRIYEGESFFLSQLSKVVNFDRELFVKAREMKLEDAIRTLRDMSEDKKEALAGMLNQAANADGKVQEAELKTIYDIFSRAGMDFDNF